MPESFDYVVVGAGSAGCVLANRLSADGRARVLVLEAGSADRNPMIKVPILTRLLYTMPSLNWGYDTVEQPQLGGRKVHWPRGKVLGGSSSINGMVYIRGVPRDFDDWRQSGCVGWSYEDVVPYFKKSEAHTTLGEPLHGRDGDLTVGPISTATPLDQAFVDACQGIGVQPVEDFNAPPFEGAGFHHFTMKHGRRYSAADAFLRPALSRPNLDVRTRAFASRVLFEGARASGVAYRRDGDVVEVTASRGVILCGGAVNSPQLLMLSGIGDGEDLRSLGIAVKHHIPGVGRNLQDHVGCYVSFETHEPVGIRDSLRPDRAVRNVIQSYLFGTGPGSAMPLRASAMMRSREGLDGPDIKMTMIPALVVENPWRRSDVEGFMINAYKMRPESRGRISLRSADPRDKPSIDPGYLSATADLVTACDSIRRMRSIVGQPALAGYVRAEIGPGDAVQNDDDLERWAMSQGTTTFHPVGTCRMGVGVDAVVNPELRVRGVEGLWVADASVMPNITSGNTNAPTMMIAEKAADLIANAA